MAVRRAARFEAEADPADELRISGVGPAFGLALIGLGIVELAFGAGLGGTWLISSAGSCSPAARAQQA